MESLNQHDVVVILLGGGVLLGLARLLGELATRIGQPAVVGEIVAGILLGPTVLGQLAPALGSALFPPEGAPAAVLGGLTLVSVVLFLFAAGMEVDLSTIFRQGRAAMTVSLSGILVPFALGLAAAWLFPRTLGRMPEVSPWLFALFFATAMSISALPVIAKILMDINLYRSDLGMVVLAAAVFDDLAGWLVFAVIIAMMGFDTGHGMGVGVTLLMTLAYAGLMISLGRALIHRLLPWMLAKTTWPAGVLGFCLSGALLCAALTEWIGVHAIFGAFLFGVALGDTPHFRERTRVTIDHIVASFFAPLFFATIGLRVDFIHHFDWPMALLVLLIACACKVLGCTAGARLGGMSPRESWAVGFGMNARGTMGIILGALALQFGLIGEPLFVALVLMALVTSIASGPVMQRILQRRVPLRAIDAMSARTFLRRLQAQDAEAAIRELSAAAAGASGLDAAEVERAVLARERQMPTGLESRLAVPHARLPSLQAPVVCAGFAPWGIDFHGPDARTAQLVFLLLTPREDAGAQLELLADIAETFGDPSIRSQALGVETFTELEALLRTERRRETAALNPA